MLPETVRRHYAQGTLVFGHRGASGHAPMNTMAAFRLAREMGAAGVELDVHRSADGHAVIVHDFSVDATTDGSGLVASMTLAQLRELDAGSWFGEAFRGEKIPTLDEVFEELGRDWLINVEIKSVSAETDGVEQVVADCIVRHGMQDHVIVSSFNPAALWRFRALQPATAVGFLTTPGLLTDIGADFTYEAEHPQHETITAEIVQNVHQAGRVINTWTVNEPSDALRLRAMGVNGIISDFPDRILAAFGSI